MKKFSKKLIRNYRKHSKLSLLKQKKPFVIPPISIEVPWLKGLTRLEVYSSVFTLSEEYNKHEFNTRFLRSFHLPNEKMDLQRSLVAKKFHPTMCNLEQWERAILENMKSWSQKKRRPKPIILY